MELLATVHSNEYVRFNINDITKYKYLILNCCVYGAQRVVASTIIPTGFIAYGSDHPNSARFMDASSYEAQLYFTSATECYLRSKSMYDRAILYGVI